MVLPMNLSDLLARSVVPRGRAVSRSTWSDWFCWAVPGRRLRWDPMARLSTVRIGWQRLGGLDGHGWTRYWFEGSRDEAFVEFVRRNVAHGLLLTLRERKRAAVQVLGSPSGMVGSSGGGGMRDFAEDGCSAPTRCTAVQLGEVPNWTVAYDSVGITVVGRCSAGLARARVVEALRTEPAGSSRAAAAAAGGFAGDCALGADEPDQRARA